MCSQQVDIHEHVFTNEFFNFCEAMEALNIHCVHKELIARDIPDEFKKYMGRGVLGQAVVVLFNKYVDIIDLLKEASKRQNIVHKADDVSCVFFFDGMFGIIPKEETSEERWITLFKNMTDEDRRCIICYGECNRKSTCMRCGQYTCADCVGKSQDSQCAYCRQKLIR